MLEIYPKFIWLVWHSRTMWRYSKSICYA